MSIVSRRTCAVRALAALLALTVVPSPSLAQLPLAAPTSAAAATPETAPAPADSTVARRGPTLDGARAAAVAPAHTQQQDAAAGAMQQQSKNLGKPLALMVVGGAALVAGLLIGDTEGTLLAFGGAIVGLVGLYQYLR
jgi:hypothetical protein